MNTPSIKERFEALSPLLDERMRRLVAATEANLIGHGGVERVSKETGVSCRAIAKGRKELRDIGKIKAERIRKPGGGRKSLAEKTPALKEALESLVDPVTRGDPESPLRWTCKSVRNLAEKLKQQGYPVSHVVVSQLLKEMGYSLQANRKTQEGKQHPDRNAQFEYIHEQVQVFQSNQQPVISVDTKKKELIGNFRNGGKEYHPEGEPEEVKVYDFEDKALGKVAPYGVYDITRNTGWVNVGISSDTAAFAVNSIRQWWGLMGKACYPEATQLLITADGGGSNGHRVKLWKSELQKLADETGLSISVSHLPPGTSKWNKIEHRLFSQITQNWRGRPLISHETVVNLIASTKNSKGLTVKCQLDTNQYQKGIKVTDEELKALNIERNAFHGEWNYTISPRLT
jgi:transposase